MKLEKEQVTLRTLIAEEGKVIISKETTINEETGEKNPVTKAKKIYLGKNDSEENYTEIDESEEK